MSTRWKVSSFALAVTVTLGCGVAGEDESTVTATQNVTPTKASTVFDQARVCDATLQRHLGTRRADLRDGLLRWTCGDVPGVTGEDRGQEYCEYHAVVGGKRVTRASELPDGASLSCLFTSLFKDVRGAGAASAMYGEELANALGGEENLGARPEADLVRMQLDANSRAAADQLIGDCEDGTSSDSPRIQRALLDDARQTACYELSLRLGASAVALCRGVDLSDDARWAKVEALGAKVASPSDANYDWQREIATCLRTPSATPKPWRNSDAMICGRVARMVGECSASYAKIPSSVEGFTFTGWTNDALPTGCRFAKIDSKEYGQLVICEAARSEVEDLRYSPAFADDLQEFCHQRFANNLVMMAPLRALQKSAPSTEGAFCALASR